MERPKLRLWGVGVSAVLAAVLLSACEPPTRPVFTVTSVADGRDRAVGDGVCEVTLGAGDCSLRAAMAEANAAGSGDVVVRAGTYELTVADEADGDPDLDVLGDVRINVDRREAVVVESLGRIADVHTGGRLAGNGLYLTTDVNTVANVIQVDGALVLGESTIAQGLDLPSPVSAPALDIGPTGAVVLSNSEVWGTSGDAAVVNRGSAQVAYSTLNGLLIPAVRTEPGGQTVVAASQLIRKTVGRGGVVDDPAGAACSGASPTSNGYNRALNSACQLTAKGDTQVPAAPWVDRVPVGELGCGTGYIVDRQGRVRPEDGDFDGTPACDTGAIERGQRILIANTSLPQATVGSCYGTTLFGNGATRPYTWSATGLPPGLAVVNDRIAGIPTTAGSFEVHVTARAVDGGGSTSLTIDVAPSDDPPMVSC